MGFARVSGFLIDRIGLGFDRAGLCISDFGDLGDAAAFEDQTCHIPLGQGKSPAFKMRLEHVLKSKGRAVDFELQRLLILPHPVAFKGRQRDTGYECQQHHNFQNFQRRMVFGLLKSKDFDGLFGQHQQTK